jgi:hypothetical protein
LKLDGTTWEFNGNSLGTGKKKSLPPTPIAPNPEEKIELF